MKINTYDYSVILDEIRAHLEKLAGKLPDLERRVRESRTEEEAFSLVIECLGTCRKSLDEVHDSLTKVNR